MSILQKFSSFVSEIRQQNYKPYEIKRHAVQPLQTYIDDRTDFTGCIIQMTSHNNYSFSLNNADLINMAIIPSLSFEDCPFWKYTVRNDDTVNILYIDIICFRQIKLVITDEPEKIRQRETPEIISEITEITETPEKIRLTRPVTGFQKYIKKL